MTTDVFAVLADPHRRRVLELVAARERTAGELAAEFDVSRPAVSRHLRVLKEAGLVTCRQDAQRRIYRLDPGPLTEVAGWVDRMRGYWAGRLDALEDHLDANPEVPNASR
ncbi:ArsR/SmtB family transcription factor [Prauserella endophytica]|uniref:Winged helix-turn-helix transcriptional regulator n=1 Tax=Prauserella endophytica TaxID=1592324 RepID=A0ABY2S8U6_9PSEU|nr:metalloregulator ArsR/SmtB family transcription factor [Prauserella endophytica]TKG72337.1 winged helix-turn-helix transcriptional regulator [Prauserella endophytica]